MDPFSANSAHEHPPHARVHIGTPHGRCRCGHTTCQFTSILQEFCYPRCARFTPQVLPPADHCSLLSPRIQPSPFHTANGPESTHHHITSSRSAHPTSCSSTSAFALCTTPNTRPIASPRQMSSRSASTMEHRIIINVVNRHVHLRNHIAHHIWSRQITMGKETRLISRIHCHMVTYTRLHPWNTSLHHPLHGATA